MTFITAPLPSAEAYIEHLSRHSLPVLRRTVREINVLKADIDTLNSRHIAAMILNDPLMTVRLLIHLELHRSRSQNHDITTIDNAIMMMGFRPFFDTFSNLPTVEDVLAQHPKALIGLLKVINRARKVSFYARDWAILRHDLDVEEITVAALLKDITEIVFWIFAPTLTQRVFDLQLTDRSMRSVTAQEAVFGVNARELQFTLVRAWKLPGLLIQLLDETQAENPRVRTVRLASMFVRHMVRGWDDAGLPSDVDAIAKLLPVGREQLLNYLGVPEEMKSRFMGRIHS